MRQKGIVLISALVFLIVILLLLKIVLGSSQFAERKTGVGYEIHNAEAAAQMAIRQGEKYILDAGYINGSARVKASDYPECTTGTQDEDKEACNSALMQARYDYWSSLQSNIDGVYLVANTECKVDSKDQPLWACADWGNNFNHYLTGSTKALKTLAVEDQNLIGDFQPRYIIQVTPLENESISFNIVGLGFGRNSSIGGNVTNVMLGATYILSR